MGKEQATSKTGHFERSGSETQTMFNVFAASPPKPKSLYGWSFASSLFSFLIMWLAFSQILGTAYDPEPVRAFIYALMIGLAIWFFSTKFFRDKREHAHDSRFSVNARRLLKATEGGGEAQMLVADIEHFSVRNSLTGETAYAPTPLAQHSSVARSAIIGGVAGEALMGTSALRGSVGMTTGAIAGTATAVTNTVGAAQNAIMTGMHNARLKYKAILADHSYVVEAVSRTGAKLTLAGGLNRNTALELMHSVNDSLETAVITEEEHRAQDRAS